MGTGTLDVLNGGFEGMTYDLTGDDVVIGRNPTTDITLLDEGIRREHALVLFDEDARATSSKISPRPTAPS